MNKLIYILFLFFTCLVFSQEKIEGVKIDTTLIKQKKFDQKALEWYKNQDDFNYQHLKEKENFITTFKNWLQRLTKKFLSLIFDDISPAVGVLAFLLKTIPWIVLSVVLYFILQFFVGKYSEKEPVNLNQIPSTNFVEDEELINHKNLKQLIETAISDKDYALAIRFYYLLVLQKLIQKKHIIWQQEKTNEDFIKEVGHLKIANDFKEITRFYDFVWYGNFKISESDFLRVQPLFQKTIHSIIG